MKKKVVIHISLILLLTIVFILGYPFAFYYPNLAISDFIFYIPEWSFFFVTLGIISIVSLTSICIGKKNNIKLLKHMSFMLLSAFLIFLMVFFITEHLQFKKEYNEMLLVYIDQAKEEIEYDKVKIEYFGIDNWIKEGKKNAVDSISKQYGVQLIGLNESRLNCAKKARETYLEIVNAYLDKRNGEEWRLRMNKELEPYIDTLVVAH